MEKIIIIVMITLLLISAKMCSNKTSHIKSISDYYNEEIVSYKNELERMEYKIYAKDKTIENMRVINAEKYYKLRNELKERGIRIQDLKNRVEFESTFSGNITLENRYSTDTMYLYLPLDSTINFEDGYLSAFFTPSSSTLDLEYIYKPGRIYIDTYKKRQGFLKPKKSMTSIQFENPNVDLVNTDVVFNQKKLKAVIGIGVGYNLFVSDGNLLLKPSVGVNAQIPIIKFYD